MPHPKSGIYLVFPSPRAWKTSPRGVGMKPFSVLLGLCLLASACTSPVEPPQDTKPTPQVFKAPKKVRPPKVKPNLSAANIKRCLDVDKIDLASLAGRYFGPIDLVSDQVRETREISFSTPTDIDFVDSATFSDLLEGDGRGPVSKDRAVDLWLQWQLGFRLLGSDGSSTPPGKGRELIDGYYEHDSGHIVVKQDGELDVEYVVLAHELGHAAVDQSFGIPDKETLRIVDDSTLATTARIEGDATLLELRFLARLSGRGPVRKYVKGLVAAKADRRDRRAGVPHAVLERFSFPYRWGVAFACSVFDRGGWAAVDRIHRKPPTTTAEIMFPERYLKRQRAQEPAALGSPGRPWKSYARGTFGAADLKVMFEAPADSDALKLSQPLGRAAAWNGGSFELWGRGVDATDSVLGISLVEHRDHPGLLCSSMLAWYRLAFRYAEEEVIADGTVRFSDPNRTTIMSCQGRDIRIAMAPTEPLANAVLEGS